MSSTRVYVGGLPTGVRERDVESFFEGFGRTKEILLKNGYGFVEFEDSRDADDAVYQMNGKELMGRRVVVEAAKSLARDRNRDRYDGDRRGGRFNETSRNTRFGPPIRTEYRVIVENLSSSVSWQDLKDYVRSAGEVTYCDAHKERRNEGVVEFASSSDMRRAIEKLDATELSGRRIRLFEDHCSRRRGGGRGRSRSNSRSVSRSRYRSKSRSKSKSAGRSHSRSPDKKSRELSKSRSRSCSRKRSKSPRPSRSKRESRSPSKSRGNSRHRSRSRSPSTHSPRRGRSRSRSRHSSRSRRSRSRKRSKSPRPSRSNRESRSPSKSRGNSRHRSRSRSRRYPRSSARDSRDRAGSRSVSPRKGKDSRPMYKSMDD